MEYTLNRVGDTFFDQVVRSGHYDRPDDLARFAGLGLQALRYGVLWERHFTSDGSFSPQWLKTDAQLAQLRDLGLRPIVGLVHHGSGPAHTNLLDPAFPAGLARFAAQVAERYPWLTDYTPVNEPLTTARFSGLYGHWYPHAHDPQSFGRALIGQCRAVVLAMEAIRRINPQARLVQTDDLAKTFSRPALAYQANFENERRWLTFDLLNGWVDRQHPMWGYLRWAGCNQADVEWFLEHSCPPDVIGLNYYLTSERFLDERSELYPAASRGSNGRHEYADVEAVRVRSQGLAGVRGLVREAWERYGQTLALTEVHNGCTREEQLRWFDQTWQTAQSLRAEGVALEAVTAWALLGSYDWNSLVTRSTGYYEPGVFDLRAPQPRPTALAALLSDLAAGRTPRQPVLTEPGWWERPARFIFGFRVDEDGERLPVESEPARRVAKTGEVRPILIVGGDSRLGQRLARLCEERGLSHHRLSRYRLDITDSAAISQALAHWRPWAVINTAGYTDLEKAEREPARCFWVNTDGSQTLALACARHAIKLVSFSCAQVFDGQLDRPYRESDPTNPLNAYGRSKVAAEKVILANNAAALVIRSGEFFDDWPDPNFLTTALQTLAAHRVFEADDAIITSPTYLPDLGHACLDLLIDDERGIWHLANSGATSQFGLIEAVARQVGLDLTSLRSGPGQDSPGPVRRPVYSVLGSERGELLPPLSDALDRYARAYLSSTAGLVLAH